MRSKNDRSNSYHVLSSHPDETVNKIGKFNFDTLLKAIYTAAVNSINTSSGQRLITNQFLGKYFSESEVLNFIKITLHITPKMIATLLKLLRVQNGYSLSELSKLTGFSKSSISHRESSDVKTFPNIITISMYLKAFELTFSIFLLNLTVMGRESDSSASSRPQFRFSRPSIRSERPFNLKIQFRT